ncbi:hypothetical protein AWH48_12220 [Domibacillus aminovorans]|uniref:Nuclease SbcCD subunit C n=1 Tax=Domibacillus aminovorans TaxID=29332 RepID=A0A177KJP9_9BACI|nr:hypothetical protein [Domibacillus aminovorans]OAH53115.1 hypothetical protein AWH48_12220 [Domibacillus aminovorans]
MEISFEHIEAENFKNHEAFSTNMSAITNIYGRNGAGKSSIGDAVTWLLYGTDQLGTKLDAKPIDQPDAESKVTLKMLVDGKEATLTRAQNKTAKYYLNEVPEKATAFNEHIEALFDKDLFLSMFNPIYFFTQNWKEQRAQVLRYVDEPLNTEVFAEMSNVQAQTLQEQLKKHSLDDLEKVHKERFKQRDVEYTKANERHITLQEQLEKEQEAGESIDPVAIQKEIDALINERDSLDEKRQEAYSTIQKRNALLSQIEFKTEAVMKQKDIVYAIRDEKVQDSCRTCGQAMNEEATNAAKQDIRKRFMDAVEHGKKLTAELNTLKEQLAEMPVVELPDTQKRSIELDESIYSLMAKRDSAGRLSQLASDIEQASENKQRVLQERNESQELIDSIKVFRTKQAEVMVKKVDSLFTTISVRLFEQLKNGELKDTFEIEMDGKPYSKLSTAEKIKCGLEMVGVLSQQSGVIVPTFVDNAESILKYTAPTGQLIAAKVKAGDLKIEVKDEIKEVAS